MTDRKPLPVGQLLRINLPNMDDNDGEERHAPAGETCRITSADYYANQGWTYGFVQEPSGVCGFATEEEIRRGDFTLL